MARRKLPKDKVPQTVARAFAKIEQAGHAKDLESIEFIEKPAQQTAEPYKLKLTPLQRQSLLQFGGLTAKQKKMLTDSGDGTTVVRLTQKEIERLNDKLVFFDQSAPSADQKRLTAVLEKIRDIYVPDLEDGFDEVAAGRRQVVKPGDRLFQFKVALLEIRPLIWRRILVPDGNLLDLHEDIQAAFGWWNYHLHQFEIKGVRYSVPSPYDDDFEIDFQDETQVLLSDLIPQPTRSSKWVYEYDFGDSWLYEIVFEMFVIAEPRTKYPMCVGGNRACPPEDCGGPWGYFEYLEAISNPRHEQHEFMREWRGSFDPEEFDAKKATRQMRRAR